MISEYLFVALACIFLYKYFFERPKNFPPGLPRSFPIIGSYFLLFLLNRKKLYLGIEKLSQFYKSKVVGLYIGNTPTVVANDEKTVREIFFNKDYDGRADIFLGRLRTQNFNLRGIFFTEGDFWQDQRRFTLRNMRDFGFGRRLESYEIEVENEIKSFINMIKNGPIFEHEEEFLKHEGILSLPKGLICCVGNCFLQALTNIRLNREDQWKLYGAGISAMKFQETANEFGNLITISPWVRYIFPVLSNYRELRRSSINLLNFIKEIVDDHLKKYENGDDFNFLDTYTKQIKNENGFDYDQFLMVCTDFIFPALSAVEAQISFLFRTLLQRQDILIKIQAEIDEVVGNGRLPNLNDRVHLNFTEATLRENMRYHTVAHGAVGHKSLVDTKLGDYDVPKDSFVIANLHAFHNSKESFGDPESFRPERFLDKDGKLSLKLDKSLPFGGGRRLCAGETFARNTIFLVVIAILQNFNIKSHGQVNNEDIVGLIQIPKDFWIKMETR